MRARLATILAVAFGIAFTACRGYDYIPPEAIIGSEVNREAFPNVRIDVPKSDEEALLGNRPNPEFVRDIHQGNSSLNQ